MSDHVDTYEPLVHEVSATARMGAHPNGTWVKVSDYDAAVCRAEEAEKMASHWDHEYVKARQYNRNLENRIADLESKLAALSKTTQDVEQITHSPGCWSFGPRHYECACQRLTEYIEKDEGYPGIAKDLEDCRAKLAEAERDLRLCKGHDIVAKFRMLAAERDDLLDKLIAERARVADLERDLAAPRKEAAEARKLLDEYKQWASQVTNFSGKQEDCDCLQCRADAHLAKYADGGKGGMNHVCTITSWHRFYRLPIMRLFAWLEGSKSGKFFCTRCGAYYQYGERS